MPFTGELLSGDYYFGLEMEYWDVDKWTSAVYPMAYTNHEVVNPYEPPFTYNIAANAAEAQKMFNILDANENEGTATWYIDGTGAVISYDSSDPKDDWLFSMPLKLSASKIYSLSVKAKDNGYPERIEVKAGAAGTVEAMTIDVIAPTVLDEGSPVILDGEFSVEADGVYFIGFHACSDPDEYSITISEFSMDIAASMSAPGAVQSFTAVPYYFGETPEVRIAFITPTVTIGNAPLDAIDKVVIERDGEIVREFTEIATGQIVEYNDPCAEGTYKYTVYAVADGEIGAKTDMEVKVSAVYGDNFTYSFTDNGYSAEALFTVINANNDEKTWTFTAEGPRVEYNPDSKTSMDDWLISMPMVLKGGNVYTFTVKAVNGRGYAERLALYLGNNMTVAAMTDCVTEPTDFDGVVTLTGTYACHSDAVKYLGIHGCSDADMNYILLRSMQVEPTGECEVFNIAHNLKATGLDLPKNPLAGGDMTVGVNIENTGLESMNAYIVRLFMDDELVGEATGKPMPSGAKSQVDVTFSTTIFHAGEHTLRGEIVADNDEVEDDNVTTDYTVTIDESVHPKINDLTANAADADVTLEWSAPSTEGTGVETVTESFEDYPAFSIGMPWSEVENDNLGDWTVIDADGLECYQLQANCNFAPNYNTHPLKPRAWMVMNAAQSGHTPGYVPLMGAATGSQNIVCIGAIPSGSVTANDDWLISPLLSGNAQTITFKAKSYYSYTESFEVLVSITGKDIADFTKIGEVESVPYSDDGDYKEYSYDLPAGTLYFAIRCVSSDKYALVIDDITYERTGGADSNLQILGYNVYRNYELITPEPIAHTHYVDSNVGDGQHVYHVNVVYDRGESGVSNPAYVDITTTGIDTITAEQSMTVSQWGGVITVAGVESRLVELFSADGRRIAAEIAAPVATFTVAPGAYVVRSDNNVKKVLVR